MMAGLFTADAVPSTMVEARWPAAQVTVFQTGPMFPHFKLPKTRLPTPAESSPDPQIVNIKSPWYKKTQLTSDFCDMERNGKKRYYPVSNFIVGDTIFL